MCGICGILDHGDRGTATLESVRRMSDVIAHRGPDDGRQHVEPGVALGHRRLAIIDVSSGQQPLTNEDGSVVIVFNGEIYNFQELAAELAAAGHTFCTHSDTEVIVHAWEQWGERCVERFNGMFAFAIWDRSRRTLFLARDRLGEKPLYYTWLDDGTFVFGSELKSLLVHPRVNRTLDPRAIEEYLALGYVPDPRSVFQSISKLPPGHLLTIRLGAPRPVSRAYWDLKFAPRGVGDAAALAEETVARLREATHIRLMSEVPLGAFLSGGVDSSAVVAMMAGLSEAPVSTCSISFGDPQFNESAYAQAIADRFHTRHYVEQAEMDDFDLLDKLVEVYDEPFGDSSAMPTYRVCQLARRRVTVALSGDGGDETFAGYRRYKWHMNEELLRSRLPRWFRRPVFAALGTVYPKLDWAPRIMRAKSTFQALAYDSMEAYFHSVSVMPDPLRLSLYGDAFLARLGEHRAIDVFRAHAENAPDDALSLAQYLDFKTYLPGDILVKVDRASMAHSLEVRVPFLDHTFVEWAATLPPNLKLRGGEGKYVLKKGLEAHLPHDIMYRRKMGFAVPLASWLRGPLRERVSRLVVDGALNDAGIFDRARLRALVDQHLSGTRDHSAPLWSLLMLEGFLRLRA